jgi:hypothetical protein
MWTIKNIFMDNKTIYMDNENIYMDNKTIFMEKKKNYGQLLENNNCCIKYIYVLKKTFLCLKKILDNKKYMDNN